LLNYWNKIGIISPTKKIPEKLKHLRKIRQKFVYVKTRPFRFIRRCSPKVDGIIFPKPKPLPNFWGFNPNFLPEKLARGQVYQIFQKSQIRDPME